MVRMDKQLNEFKSLIFEMAKKVSYMHEKALACALDGDVNLALDIIKMDEYVNNYEFEVNDRGLEVLALLAPVASDLRIVLCGIKITTDLERIGDYAKNIAKFVIKNGKIDDVYVPHIVKASDLFFNMFHETMRAYNELNEVLAMELPERDNQIEKVLSELTTQIEKNYEKKKDLSDIARVLNLVRCYERASDHTKNINEHIIYQVKGQHYDFG